MLYSIYDFPLYSVLYHDDAGFLLFDWVERRIKMQLHRIIIIDVRNNRQTPTICHSPTIRGFCRSDRSPSTLSLCSILSTKITTAKKSWQKKTAQIYILSGSTVGCQKYSHENYNNNNIWNGNKPKGITSGTRPLPLLPKISIIKYNYVYCSLWYYNTI